MATRYQKIAALIEQAYIRADFVIVEAQKYLDHEKQQNRVAHVRELHDRLSASIEAIEKITVIGCKPSSIDRHHGTLAVRFSANENQFQVRITAQLIAIARKRVRVKVAASDDVEAMIDAAVRELDTAVLLRLYLAHIQDVLNAETTHLAWLEAEV